MPKKIRMDKKLKLINLAKNSYHLTPAMKVHLLTNIKKMKDAEIDMVSEFLQYEQQFLAENEQKIDQHIKDFLK